MIIIKQWMKKGCSTYQMDNFYEMLSKGIVKSSGIMNYIQHIYIANQLKENDYVLDLCCGRGLMIPIINYYAPFIAGYTGVDISNANIIEAKNFIKKFKIRFLYGLIEGDVKKLNSFINKKFDLILYTSAIEHLNRDAAIESLRQAKNALVENGTLFLSTPRTKYPCKLQYKVHIYEWDKEEIEAVLYNLGFKIVGCIGLLPPKDSILVDNIKDKFGQKSVDWFKEMKRNIPKMFLDTVMASCFPESAKELLFICRK